MVRKWTTLVFLMMFAFISVFVIVPKASAASTGLIKESVSFRGSPSTSGFFIRYLQVGEMVSILYKVNDYWYRIKDPHGMYGYVSTQSKYIATSIGTSSSSTSSTTSTSKSTKVEAIIKAGLGYLGTPYEYGSNRSSTATFDCSDFIRRIFIKGANLTLPADSRQQGEYVKNKGNTTTSWRQLNRGDLMYFMAYKGTSASNYTGINKSIQRITHTGIYLGDGKILHTHSSKTGGVRVDSIAGKHWEYRFMFGGSFL